jgi:hypothetical protein
MACPAALPGQAICHSLEHYFKPRNWHAAVHNGTLEENIATCHVRDVAPVEAVGEFFSRAVPKHNSSTGRKKPSQGEIPAVPPRR